jgi:cysteine desulfuration protein SufE
MTIQNERIPPALAEIMTEFREADDREKLELLLEFSDELPDLPAHLEHVRDQLEVVEECQSPVAIHAEMNDGQMEYYFAIPESAPTVRGFAGIMLEGVQGATPEEVLQIPSDFFIDMGLNKVLSPQRMNGIAAILAHMKRMAVPALEG